MRGLNLQAMQAQQPQQGGSLISPQSLGMLMQAYKAYQGQQTPLTPGATGTDYAGSQQQGTGYGMGQPLVAGGESGQSPMVGQNPLMDAMTRQRMQAGAGRY